MKEKFIQELKLEEKTEEEQDIELIKSVIKAKLDYLLKKVKNKSLVLDMVEEIRLRIYENEAI